MEISKDKYYYFFDDLKLRFIKVTHIDIISSFDDKKWFQYIETPNFSNFFDKHSKLTSGQRPIENDYKRILIEIPDNVVNDLENEEEWKSLPFINYIKRPSGYIHITPKSPDKEWLRDYLISNII